MQTQRWSVAGLGHGGRVAAAATRSSTMSRIWRTAVSMWRGLDHGHAVASGRLEQVRLDLADLVERLQVALHRPRVARVRGPRVEVRLVLLRVVDDEHDLDHGRARVDRHELGARARGARPRAPAGSARRPRDRRCRARRRAPSRPAARSPRRSDRPRGCRRASSGTVDAASNDDVCTCGTSSREITARITCRTASVETMRVMPRRWATCVAIVDLPVPGAPPISTTSGHSMCCRALQRR